MSLLKNCTGEDHYLQAVICRSRDGLSANEKKENFALNDNDNYLLQMNFFLALIFQLMEGLVHPPHWYPG